MMGIDHLDLLVNKVYGQYIAANKFLWSFQPLAWDCLQFWHFLRVEQEIKTGEVSKKFRKFEHWSRFFLTGSPEMCD